MHPMPVKLALEWWKASGEKTEERLNSLINHFCYQLDFPVTDDHRKDALKQISYMMIVEK